MIAGRFNYFATVDAVTSRNLAVERTCERTPYDLVASDIEMEDLCSDVPLERTSLSKLQDLLI